MYNTVLNYKTLINALFFLRDDLTKTKMFYTCNTYLTNYCLEILTNDKSCVKKF